MKPSVCRDTCQNLTKSFDFQLKVDEWKVEYESSNDKQERIQEFDLRALDDRTNHEIDSNQHKQDRYHNRNLNRTQN